VLTHLDKNDRPKMVDVSDKSDTYRVAVASGIITMSDQALHNVLQNRNKKGPVLQTAVVASIQGAKQTSTLIPMCHPLLLTSLSCDIQELKDGFKLTVTAKLKGQTGVEMEALTGVSVGLLTIYDMVKAVDKTMVIKDIKLLQKSGGKSGTYEYNMSKT